MERVKNEIQFIVCIAFSVLYSGLVQLFPQVFANMFIDHAELVEYTVCAMHFYMTCAFFDRFQQSFLVLGNAKVSLFLACFKKTDSFDSVNLYSAVIDEGQGICSILSGTNQ